MTKKNDSTKMKKGLTATLAVATIASQLAFAAPSIAKAEETETTEPTATAATPRALALWTGAKLKSASITPLNLDTQVGGSLALDFSINAWGAGLAEDFYMTTNIPVEFRPLVNEAFKQGILFQNLIQTGKFAGPLGMFPTKLTFDERSLTYDEETGLMSIRSDQKFTVVGQASASYQMNLDYKTLYNTLKVNIPDATSGNGYYIQTAESSSGIISIELGDRGAEAFISEKQAIVGTGGLPEIKGADAITTQVNEEFNPLAGVTASDKEDGDLTGKIEVISDVNVNKPGVYKVSYSITDSDRNVTKVDRVVTVSDEHIIGNITPKAYKIGQESVTGAYYGDVATIALVVNGKEYNKIPVKADGSFSYYAEDKIKNNDDDVRMVAYSAYGKQLDNKPVKITSSQGTMTPKVYKVGETNISGTYTGDVASARLYVNGVVQSSGGTFANGGFNYYVGAGRIKAGDIVTMDAFSKDGTLIEQNIKVTVEGVSTSGSIKANDYKVGDTNITGTYTGDVKRLRLYINGVSQSWGGIVENGTFKYYVGSNKISATDRVTMNVYDKDDNLLQENAPVKVINASATGSISPAEYAIGDNEITGTYTGDVAKARISINGKAQAWGGSFSNGRFSYYVGNGKIKAGDKVTITAYDKNDNVLDANKNVSIKVDTVKGTISPSNYSVGDVNVTGTYTGSVAKARLSINGKEQAWGGSFSGGTFSYYIGANKIKAGDNVTITAYDSNDKALDSNKKVVIN